MKRIFTIILILLGFSGFGQDCPTITATTGTVSCTSPCTSLNAAVSMVRNTNTYTVNPMPYTPYSYTAGTGISTATDDIYSGIITMPFNFCFFGNSYNQLIIGSNGNICFNTALAGLFDPWSISGPLPGSSGNATYNSIFLWKDIYPPAGGGSIVYNVYGTAPCRKFVVSWNNLAMFIPPTCTNRATHQIVLHESSNIIDIYIGTNVPCLSWNSGRAITGIQSSTPGTFFFTAPGQNGTAFTATNQGWRFLPNGGVPTWTYTWIGPSGTVGSGPSVIVCPTTTTTYTVTATTTACAGVSLTTTTTVTSTIATVGISGDSTMCRGNSVVLTPTVVGGSWISSVPSVASVSSGIVTGVSSGTSVITYGLGPACQGTKTVTVNPTYDQSFSDHTCQGTPYLWIDTSILDNGPYTKRFLTVNGCDSSITLNLTVYPVPTIKIGLTKDYECLGDTVFLTWENPESGTTYWFQPPTIPTATEGGSYPISFSPEGTYQISGVAKTEWCQSDTVKKTLLVSGYPDAEIIPKDTSVCLGDEIVFEAKNPVQGNFYIWKPTQCFPHRTENVAVAIIDSSRWIGLMVANRYGCMSYDSMFVKGEDCCKFFIPSAFTPNGDGRNDFFKPIPTHIKIIDFKVYNRYGETVFQNSGTGQGWNGSHKGVPCDMGVYFWQAVYDCYGKSRMEKGDVTLVR